MYDSVKDLQSVHSNVSVIKNTIVHCMNCCLYLYILPVATTHTSAVPNMVTTLMKDAMGVGVAGH